MSDITLKAILTGDASSFNTAVQLAVQQVTAFRDAQQQASAAGQAFEQAINNLGISTEEYAKAQEYATSQSKVFTDQQQRAEQQMLSLQEAALKANQALDESHSVTGQLAEALEGFGGVGHQAAEILTGFGDAAGAAALTVEFFRESLNELGTVGNNLSNLVAKTGLSADTLEIWRESAAVTGVSADQLGMSIDRLAARVEMGNKQAAAGLAALHMSTEEFMSLNPEERLQAVVTGLTDIEDASHKAAVATELLGRGGLQMLPALTEEAQKYREELEAIGGGSEEVAEAGKKWTESTNALAVEWEHVKLATGAWLLLITAPDALLGLDKQVTDFEKKHPWLDAAGETAGRFVGGAIGVQTTGQVEENSKGWMPKLEGSTAASVAEGVNLTGGGGGGLPNFSGQGMGTLLNDQLAESTKQTHEWAAEQKKTAKETADAWRVFTEQMEQLRVQDVASDRAAAALKKKNDEDLVAGFKEKEDEQKVADRAATDFAKSLVEGMAAEDKAFTDQLAADDAAWHEHLDRLVGDWQAVGSAINSVGSILSSLGVGADSVAGKPPSLAGSLASGIGGAIKTFATGNIFDKISAGIGLAATAIGGIMKLFGHKEEWEKVADDIGHGYSDALAKSIADTESKDKVSRALAEALHVDDMLKESGADPSTMAGTINTLMEATASGAVPAAEGVTELGKAFNDLKTAADGGSTASEAAMVKMIQRAKELGMHIPELDAAVGKMLDDAMAGMKDFYGGLSPGAGGAKQGAASQQLFGALYAAQAQTGLAEAYDKFNDVFDEMKKSFAPGTKLTGDAAEFARLEKLMTNKEFSGAARGAEGLAKATGGLLDSGNMSQGVIDALSRSLETLYGQAQHGAQAAGLKGSKADDAALKAVLPELVALQRAQALGAKLTPKESEMLAEAQAKHLLPMLDVQTQQLLTQKQIAQNTSGGGGYGPRGGTGAPYHAASGFYSPSMPAGPMAGGGTSMVVHPGERVSVTPAGHQGGGGGVQVSIAPQLHVGTVIGNPDDIVDAVVDAVHAAHPELMAALALATHT